MTFNLISCLRYLGIRKMHDFRLQRGFETHIFISFCVALNAKSNEEQTMRTLSFKTKNSFTVLLFLIMIFADVAFA